MSRVASTSAGRPHGVLRVARLWGLSRATVYRQRRPPPEAIERGRPGPRGAMPDDELVEEIRQLLENSPFHGEGYRKVRARLPASRASGPAAAGCSGSWGSIGSWRTSVARRQPPRRGGA